MAIALFISILAAPNSLASNETLPGCSWAKDLAEDARIQNCSRIIDNPSTQPSVRAQALRQRGGAKSNKKQFDAAIADFTLALKTSPRDSWSYDNRGIAKWRLGLFEAAIADLDKAVELAPESAGHYLDRGVIYDEKGLHDRAIQDYNRAIALSPDFATAYNNRCAAHVDKGLFERGFLDCEKAIELDPAFSSPFGNRGRGYLKMGKYDLAIVDLKQALILNPDYVEARKNLALAEEAIAREKSQPPSASSKPLIALDGRRVALVVGNASYRHLSALKNPANDANEVAAAFKAHGYELVGGKIWTDLSLEGMDQAIAALRKAADGAAAVVVYYSGHGEQRAISDNEVVNFLFPIDANPATPQAAERQGIRLTTLLQAMSGVKPGGLKVAMIDACRTTGKGGGKGLARIDATDMYVVYATRAGTTAADGSEVGRGTSPFVAAFVEALRANPNHDIRTLFGEVTVRMRALPERQEPEKIDFLGQAPAL